MWLCGAILLLFATSSWGAPIHDVDIDELGHTSILSRTGPEGVLEVHGIKLRGNPRDCSNNIANTVCTEWDNFRMQTRQSYGCLYDLAYTLEPVGPEAWAWFKVNITGHLYGGPEQFRQYWPLDDVKFNNYSLVTKQEDNQGIADPYWLNSEGYYIYIQPQASLFLEQNLEHEHYIKFLATNAPPYPSPALLIFNFTKCYFDDAKEAHLNAVENYLHKPTGIPDEAMTRYPIWSTWARYKTAINEETVEEFADEILKYGFENSQLEIDDLWEPCYGALEFDTKKFPSIKNLTDRLKAKGFRVTLWVHPFINTDCHPVLEEATEKGYLVRNEQNDTLTTWWNSGTREATIVDFTNPEAVEWWSNRLQNMLAESGIDSLKFDAGETSWMPQMPVLSGNITLQPNIFTLKYVEAVAKFGSMIEVRVGHRSQHLPVYVRMLDKDSRWDFENGLPTLITTLLQMNMLGYTLVLPDMVGGNGYQGAPSKELFIRWLQANVFMPAIQYSYVPWDYDQETVDICRKYTNMHVEYADKIIKAMEESVRVGTPVNAPIWWIDPTDEEAQVINDEFLLGEDLLVAPVIKEGAVSRDIYLPRGTWKNQLRSDPAVFEGPVWLRDYPAALDELPFFTLVK